MTLSQVVQFWIESAERMNDGAALGVVVTKELFAGLVDEQGHPSPLVADFEVLTMASSTTADDGLPEFGERVEISGPDRVSIYVGTRPEDSQFPMGLDPSMPVFLIPVPPGRLDNPAALEMYNRLRWFGLGPDEALAGSQG